MNLDKFNKILKIFIITLASVLVIAIICCLIFAEDNTLKENDCVKKGNICSATEIFKGVEVEIAVNDKKKQRFYVISNTENEMTLMMSKNITKRVDWHDNLLNIYGPDIALKEVADKTKSWTNIPLISNYIYEDTGKTLFEEKCKGDDDITEPNYDCTTEKIPTRGYFWVKINDGVLREKANLDENPLEDTMATDVRARIISAEEIDNLVQNRTLPNWLISNLGDNEGYWTLTSSVAIKNNYCQGAIALANVKNKPSIESLFVQYYYEPTFEIGVRPVITIDKQ